MNKSYTESTQNPYIKSIPDNAKEIYNNLIDAIGRGDGASISKNTDALMKIDPELIFYPGEKGLTPLHIACSQESVASMKALVQAVKQHCKQNGVEANRIMPQFLNAQDDKDCNTPLHVVVASNNPDELKEKKLTILLSEYRHIDVYKKNRGLGTPIDVSAYKRFGGKFFVKCITKQYEGLQEKGLITTKLIGSEIKVKGENVKMPLVVAMTMGMLGSLVAPNVDGKKDVEIIEQLGIKKKDGVVNEVENSFENRVLALYSQTSVSVPENANNEIKTLEGMLKKADNKLSKGDAIGFLEKMSDVVGLSKEGFHDEGSQAKNSNYFERMLEAVQVELVRDAELPKNEQKYPVGLKGSSSLEVNHLERENSDTFEVNLGQQELWTDRVGSKNPLREEQRRKSLGPYNRISSFVGARRASQAPPTLSGVRGG
ncbi:MAG: hypothetical protein ACJATU_000898 [Rickettsiales bacterium]|jgi:hypothetical protein